MTPKTCVFKLGVGGIIISATADIDAPAIPLNDTYRPFLSNGHPEVTLHIRYGDLPRRTQEEKFFDTKTTWKMFRSGGKYVLKISSMMAVLKPDFKSGDIFIKTKNVRTTFPLCYPLGEIILINLLAKGRGIMLHACGVKDSKKGCLFVGSSQAGKSTTANLWKKEKDATILSDDRIIVRKMENRFWIYGTPWHGNAKVSSPKRAPLGKIFFLKHAKRNSIKKIDLIEAISRLIVCSFPTFWDKEGMEFTLKFCAELAKRVSCYELGFVPDESILNFIRNEI